MHIETVLWKIHRLMFRHPIFLAFWEETMGRQIIFCVEANRQSQSDYLYISETLKRFYKSDVHISYKPVYMGSKSNYSSRKVVNEVRSLSLGYRGETRVIYFIDTDRIDIDPEQKQLFEKIEQYCQNNGYELVFFCRDVEDVFHGRQVEKSQKVALAADFRRKKLIGKVDEKSLLCSVISVFHRSNILLILDQYFERK